ncbi:MAG: polymerase sigma-70 factor, subfamily [Myxococcaceae bacterium]|nr:polymerase sigma-70 factor, subfamily [Myxococcaceae bacterium]
MESASPSAAVEDLFRRESSHLVSALVRLLGPRHVALAEDVVHDALLSAMQAWRFEIPDQPRAWILQAAKNRAIDVLRRDRRFAVLQSELDPESAIDSALSPAADAENQLTMMFAICDDALSPETHVTLILRLLCGLSSGEIARAFLVDVQTIDRRLHRGRARLHELGQLHDLQAEDEVRARQPSVEQALYLLFNEGYQGSDVDNPLLPALCSDALRLVELLLEVSAVERGTAHALAALFCFNAARLCTRLDIEGVFVPLAEQERALWNRALFERGVQHLGKSARGSHWTRWHLEAGIALEHTRAPSLAETDWQKVVEYYDLLLALSPGPVVALNRGLAIAELRGLAAGHEVLLLLEGDPKLARYSFYWAARADIERRRGRASEALALYRRAATLAKSAAERRSYERRLRELEHG